MNCNGNFKDNAARYKTRNGKLYLSFWFLGSETRAEWKQIFPSGYRNTKEAREFIKAVQGEWGTDYILEPSKSWDGYEVFYEASVMEKHGHKVDVAYHRISEKSKQKADVKRYEK